MPLTPDQAQLSPYLGAPLTLTTPWPAPLAPTRRAFKMMGIGTLMVVIFSDPMVDVMANVGKRLSVSLTRYRLS